MWSEDGFLEFRREELAHVGLVDETEDESSAVLERKKQLENDVENPTACAFATWDGCQPVPEDCITSSIEPRAQIGTRLAHVSLNRGKVNSCQVSPDATKLAVACEDGSVVVYNLDALQGDLGINQLGVILPGRAPKVRAKPLTVVNFDSDSENENADEEHNIAAESTTFEHGVKFDVSVGLTEGETAMPSTVPSTKHVENADFEPKSPRVAITPRFVMIEKPAQVSFETTPRGHEGAVTCATFSHDSLSLFTGSRDSTIKRWSLPDLCLLKTYKYEKKIEQGDVLAILLSPDGNMLHGSGENTCLTTWDVHSGQVLERMYQRRVPDKFHTEKLSCTVDFEEEEEIKGMMNAGAADTSRKNDDEGLKDGYDGSSTVDVGKNADEGKQKKHTLTQTKPKGTPIWIQCMTAAAECPAHVFTGSRDSAVRRWNVETRVCEHIFSGHGSSPVNAVAISKDGSDVFSGGGREDGMLCHYRWGDVSGMKHTWENGVAVKTGPAEGSYVRIRTFVAPRMPGTENINSKKIPAHPGGVSDIVMSSDERFVYSAGADCSVKQWSVDTGALLAEFPNAHSGGVTSLSLLPNVAKSPRAVGTAAVAFQAAAAAGGRLVSGGADGYINVWAVDVHDPVAGATMAGKIAQRKRAADARDYRRERMREAADAPELSRPAMVAKARKDLPNIVASKFPVNPNTRKPKDLEDMNAEDLVLFTVEELITVCLAHGLMCVNPKPPSKTRDEIIQTMIAYLTTEREEIKRRAREYRMERTSAGSGNVKEDGA